MEGDGRDPELNEADATSMKKGTPVDPSSQLLKYNVFTKIQASDVSEETKIVGYKMGVSDQKKGRRIDRKVQSSEGGSHKKPVSTTTKPMPR